MHLKSNLFMTFICYTCKNVQNITLHRSIIHYKKKIVKSSLDYIICNLKDYLYNLPRNNIFFFFFHMFDVLHRVVEVQ